jgi:hypothetical protein
MIRWPWSLASSHHAGQQNIALARGLAGACGVTRRMPRQDAIVGYP